ncbi:MAG: DUF2608 domain-containing protein [Alphaproteobacteria bacterium]|nr:MAG: DUF2608 domain-containing protein [Alphaproteobacteria bacterium]
MLNLVLCADILKRMETFEMRDVKKEFAQALKKYKPDEVLGVFDIDATLIGTKDPACQLPNIKKHRKIFKELTKALSKEEVFLVLIASVLKDSALIDLKTPKFLKDIQAQGVQCVACTGGGLFPKKRYEILSNLGIHFTFDNDAPQFVFEEFESCFGCKPVFYKGILGANNTPKAKVVKSHLKRTGFQPKLIIFVDDRDKEIEKFDIEGVDIITIHYKGALNFPSQNVSEEEFIQAWKQHIEDAKALKPEFIGS